MEYQRYQGDLSLLWPQGSEQVVLGGVPRQVMARLLAQMLSVVVERAEKGEKPQNIFVAVPTALMAEDLVGDLSFFWPQGRDRIHLFPALESKPYLAQSTSPDTLALRQWALYNLAANDFPRIVVASAAATLRLVPTMKDNLTRKFFIETGAETELGGLKNFLAQNGYASVGQVESRGDFSPRGDLVDIFPVGPRFPVRVELFGDMVESIRQFRIQDQRSHRRLDSLTITAASEFNYDLPGGNKAAAEVNRLASLNHWHSLLWEPLAQRLAEAESFSGLESWAPLFTPLVPLAKALGSTQTMVWEPEEFLKAAEAAWLGLSNHYERLAVEGRPHLPQAALWQSPEEILNQLSPQNPNLKQSPKQNPKQSQPQSPGGWRVRELALPEAPGPGKRFYQVHVELNPGLKATGLKGGGFFAPLVARIKSLVSRGFETHLVLRSDEQSRRVAEMLAEYELSSDPDFGSLHTRNRNKNKDKNQTQTPGELKLEVGQLSCGFVLDYDRVAYVSEDEIFGHPGRLRRRRASEDFKGLNFTGLKDLSPGDYVVHQTHGIGQYQGLVTLHLSTGIKGDFLHLEYKGGDKLYVPVELFDAVGKYVGAEGRAPSLDRLGGLTWGRVKEKVRENIRQMAEELLKLYAAREISPGHSYQGRDSLLIEFEAAFEYTETPDQQRAIEEVLADLASPKPMDRLVCGDVGYGKTEVAMRATFQVVSEKKQVAVLVPTTILAEQHGRTFEARFAPWGFKTVPLSRFKKPSETKASLVEVAQGTIDVVVGTHRLLQKDVKFKDLGLIIIDEEHRFGVADKEKLKKLRANVDVLSMSATPIPRSLSMSLSGIRDLSSIATPPQDRLAVKTTLMKYEEEAVCEAIDLELSRGGQVFLIHNQVKDIQFLGDRLRRQMPLVRFGIGHGQMKEKELEEVLGQFMRKEIDVWIATTIVESGLDFPSAGTIIIDKADRFGLAQLYQLRGRVGRGDKQAYAYLMVDNPDTLTPDAKKRLKAILDHTDLGSGYQIALHDLQIRGSGNILGAAQSGQANLVGYEMYTQLMEEAIAELKGQPLEEELEPEVATGLPAYLPQGYVPDTESRLVLYRRLAGATTFEEITELKAEMKDRFGYPPEEASNLLIMMEIKIHLKNAGIRRLETGIGGLLLVFGPQGPANYEQVMALVMDKSRQMRLSPTGKLFIGDIRLRTGADLERIRDFLPSLA